MTVVSFWAGWSTPCFVEIPYLLELEEAYADDVLALPLTLVVDRQGKLQYRHIGFSETSLIREQLKLEIETLLQQDLEAPLGRPRSFSRQS